jgi:hypothetical protein
VGSDKGRRCGKARRGKGEDGSADSQFRRYCRRDGRRSGRCGCRRCARLCRLGGRYCAGVGPARDCRPLRGEPPRRCGTLIPPESRNSASTRAAFAAGGTDVSADARRGTAPSRAAAGMSDSKVVGPMRVRWALGRVDKLGSKSLVPEADLPCRHGPQRLPIRSCESLLVTTDAAYQRS